MVILAKNDLVAIQPGKIAPMFLKTESIFNDSPDQKYINIGGGFSRFSKIPGDGTQSYSSISDNIPDGDSDSAAVVLSEIIYGTPSAALEKINEAMCLHGLSQTRLSNVRGVFHPDQHTCLRDVSRFFASCLDSAAEPHKGVLRTLLQNSVMLAGMNEIVVKLAELDGRDCLFSIHGFPVSSSEEVFDKLEQKDASGLIRDNLLGLREMIIESGGVLVGPVRVSGVDGLTYHRLRGRGGSLVAMENGSLGYGLPRGDQSSIARFASLTIGTDAISPLPYVPHLRVANVTASLSLIAKASRKKFEGKVFAVTGSAGKSTTCDLVAIMLAEIDGFESILTTYKNGNLFVGMLDTMISIKKGHKNIVVEIAAGRAADCAEICRPHVAIITHVSNAHRQAYSSIEAIAREKAAILEHTDKNGLAIICRDTACFEVFAAAAEARGLAYLTYGRHPDADWRLLSYDQASGTTQVLVEDIVQSFQLSTHGEHIALNSLAAIIAVSHTHLAWRTALPRLSAWSPLAGRGKEHVIQLSNGERIYVIDESFNAAPSAMQAALRSFDARPSRGRRVAILGEMRELGDADLECHTDVINLLNGMGIEIICFVGDGFRKAVESTSCRANYKLFSSVDELIEVVRDIISGGDEMIIKGSGASEVYKLIPELKLMGDEVAS